MHCALRQHATLRHATRQCPHSKHTHARQEWGVRGKGGGREACGVKHRLGLCGILCPQRAGGGGHPAHGAGLPIIPCAFPPILMNTEPDRRADLVCCPPGRFCGAWVELPTQPLYGAATRKAPQITTTYDTSSTRSRTLPQKNRLWWLNIALCCLRRN